MEGKCITSYDVSACFTSVPVDLAIDIIKEQLEHNPELLKRTKIIVKHMNHSSAILS